MSLGRSRAATGVAILGIVLAAAAYTQAPPSKREADSFAKKVAAMNDYGQHPSRQVHRTIVTERELNAYLVYGVGDALPAGVVGPGVSILGEGRLSGRATVDLDGVRKASNATSIFDPRTYLRGQLPLTVTGVLTTANGHGRFALESAALAGVTIPKLVLQEILSFYARTPQRPQGISLDDPFELTAHIREIQVDRGQAIIVQ